MLSKSEAHKFLTEDVLVLDYNSISSISTKNALIHKFENIDDKSNDASILGVIHSTKFKSEEDFVCVLFFVEFQKKYYLSIELIDALRIVDALHIFYNDNPVV